MTAMPYPDHLLSLEEWDALPEDRSHRCELAEGVLLVVPVPAPRRQIAIHRLTARLNEAVPDDLYAVHEVDVLINPAPPVTVRAPDVVVVPSARLDEEPVASGGGEVELASPFPLVVDLAELLRR